MKLEKNKQKTQIAFLKSEGIIKYNKNRPIAEKIGARIRKNPEITCLLANYMSKMLHVLNQKRFKISCW